MAITYKKIAEIVGVSRATVDRVMHDRGRVDPDVERRIREVAKQHGFEPNHMGRALALARNPVKIGVVVHLAHIPFFQVLLEGVTEAKAEITKLGGTLIVKEPHTFDAQAQIVAVNELVAQGVQGIAISPAQDTQLRDRLNELQEKSGIPIVTFNTDLDNLNRLCYVGVDNLRGGRAGAYLIDLLLGGTGGKVLIISGFLTHQTNYQRVDGFLSESRQSYPALEVAAIHMNADDVQKSYEITRSSIETIPDLKAIYMVSSGQEGVCRALEEKNMAGKIKTVMFDSLPVTNKYLRSGTIQFIIDQDARLQGRRAPRILFDYLFDKKLPEKDSILIQIGIKTPYTV